MMNDYATEKVREIELELAARRMRHQSANPVLQRRRGPLLGPVLRRAGRTLRRAGEGLESMATAPARPARPSEWRGFHFD